MVSGGSKVDSTRSAVPEIGPVPGSGPRPFWSVMIPTYNASDLFEKALRCVLDQDPGPDRMQIAVVDDRSPNGRSREIAARLAPGRVEFHEQPKNVGLAGNWNTGIRLSRGEWVHLFHQDDLLEPGFYERLGRAAVERPDVGAAFCRHGVVDGEGSTSLTSELERPEAGVIEDWDRRIAQVQRLRCPSIVVKRSAYERLGGFRGDLRFALDWEMWIRIAFEYPVWYEPEILAHHREHDDNETSRLSNDDAQIPDLRKSLAIVRDYSGPAHRRMAVDSLYENTVGYGWIYYSRGDRRAAWNCCSEAARAQPFRLDAWRLMACLATKHSPKGIAT